MKRSFVGLIVLMIVLSVFTFSAAEADDPQPGESSSLILSLTDEMLQLRKGIKVINVHYSSSDEYVELMNTTEKPVNLKGLILISGTNFQQYVFGEIILEPGQIIKLHSGPDATGLVWTYEYVHRDTTDGVLLNEMDGSYLSSFRWGR